MTLKITKLAFASRMIILLLQMMANWILPDHNADVFRMPSNLKYGPFPWLDKLILRSLSGLCKWDGQYFLHIANYLYSYENTLAFYPLYPVVVRYVALACRWLNAPLSLQTLTVLVAIGLNIWLFCEAANLLYKLTQHIFNDPNKSWNAALIFCFNPASIFFSAAYSEALFAYVSFYLMLECVKFNQDFSYHKICLAMAGCLLCRSNGLLALGFPIYFFGRSIVLARQPHCFKDLFKMLATVLVPLVVLHTYVFAIYREFCVDNIKVHHPHQVIDYAQERNYLLSGQGPKSSPWCSYTLPFPYTYVQSYYWDVGFLRYYQWKQMPNFLLALPILLFMHWQCFNFMRTCIRHSGPLTKRLKELLNESKSAPFVLHAAILTIVCTFYAHIQISTRLLASASPVFYWFAANTMPKTLAKLSIRSKAGAILIWCATYGIVGTVLFCNNYPWT